VQGTVLGKPAPRAACLAGAWPRLALRTLPMNTSCTSAGSTLALLRAPDALGFGKNHAGSDLLIDGLILGAARNRWR